MSELRPNRRAELRRPARDLPIERLDVDVCSSCDLSGRQRHGVSSSREKAYTPYLGTESRELQEKKGAGQSDPLFILQLVSSLAEPLGNLLAAPTVQDGEVTR